MFFCASICFICGEPVASVVDLNCQQESEVFQQEQPISLILICGIMSQFLVFVRSNQVSIDGSIWNGFCSRAMPDSRMPEEGEIERAVDAHQLMDHPAPTTTDAAPEGHEAVTIVEEVELKSIFHQKLHQKFLQELQKSQKSQGNQLIPDLR